MWAGRTLSGVDRFGTWVSAAPEGWWDSPDTKGENVGNPQRDGDMDLPTYNEARYVTLTGSLYTSGHDQMHEAGLFLTGPMSGRFQVSGHGPTQWADAVRNGRVKFTPITDTYAQWQVPLKMPDPVKYGDTTKFTVTSGSSYTELFHRGNTLSLPSLQIAGNMPGGYSIQSSAGAEYRVTTPLPSGYSHEIDMRDGMLRVNGNYSTTGVAVAGIWRISPGLKQTIRITPITTGTATMFVSVTDSYI